MARAKVIELHNREVEALSKGKRKNVYTNGSDDNYPERIELLINNSVTAKLAVNKMASFIIGKGFKDKSLNTRILNTKKYLSGYEILVMVANSIARQKGSFLQVNYNGLFKPDTIDVLPYKNCRKEKGDDLENDGKIFYSDSWGNKGFSFSKKNENAKWFYPFNRNEKVVMSQFKAEDISLERANTFRGQAFFLNLEPENIYPLAYIDPAYNDADSEYHSSVHRNNSIKNGFTDKQIIVSRATDDDNDSGIEEAIVNMYGTDGSNIALIEVESGIEDLSKEIHIASLGSNVKADRYKYFDETNEAKILNCFENVPKALVIGSDSSLIGDGGKKLSELKLNYSQDLDYVRMAISQTFKKIFPDNDWEIEPLVSDNVEASGGDKSFVSQETLNAQAALKGSVGGVQGILAIKESFSNGKTDYESAIAILVEIYGFTRDVAISLLGEIKTEIEIIKETQEVIEENTDVDNG